jgi:hypothetical protein
MRYLEEKKGIPTAFAQYGLFMHKILEKYYKDELMVFELSQYYQDNFSNNVTERFAPNKYINLHDSYYEKGKELYRNRAV